MTNQITITGTVAKDPELKFGKSGTAYLKLTVPDQKRAKNPTTNEWENKSDTTWFGVTVFGDDAELLSEQVSKGSKVVVTGRLITREYDGSDGQRRQSLEVDYATVAVVPTAARADRVQSQATNFAAAVNGDKWGTPNPTAEAPF